MLAIRLFASLSLSQFPLYQLSLLETPQVGRSTSPAANVSALALSLSETHRQGRLMASSSPFLMETLQIENDTTNILHVFIVSILF
jgi:hypothetical protein